MPFRLLFVAEVFHVVSSSLTRKWDMWVDLDNALRQFAQYGSLSDSFGQERNPFKVGDSILGRPFGCSPWRECTVTQLDSLQMQVCRQLHSSAHI